jgi:hypothetical protein
VSARLALDHSSRHPDRYLVVRYEDLTTDAARTVQSICAFVDEPYEPEMLAMAGAPRLLEKGGNSSYGTRAPGEISTDSIGRYRAVLSPREIAFAQQMAGEEMVHFGYSLDPVPMGALARSRYALTTVPYERARARLWSSVEGRQHRRGRPVPGHRLLETEGAR